MNLIDNITAWRAAGKSLRRLARESGVAQPIITRFLQGADIRLSTASRLSAFFDRPKTKTVEASALGDDWRAESHI